MTTADSVLCGRQRALLCAQTLAQAALAPGDVVLCRAGPERRACAVAAPTPDTPNREAHGLLLSCALELRQGRLPAGGSDALLRSLATGLGPLLGALRPKTLSALHPECWRAVGWDIARGCALADAVCRPPPCARMNPARHSKRRNALRHASPPAASA